MYGVVWSRVQCHGAQVWPRTDFSSSILERLSRCPVTQEVAQRSGVASRLEQPLRAPSGLGAGARAAPSSSLGASSGGSSSPFERSGGSSKGSSGPFERPRAPLGPPLAPPWLPRRAGLPRGPRARPPGSFRFRIGLCFIVGLGPNFSSQALLPLLCGFDISLGNLATRAANVITR